MKSNKLLLVVALALVQIIAPSWARGPFPRRGYIVYKDSNGYSGLADIGRRASRDAGKRAALRMLARLVRWYPHREAYSVDWETINTDGKPHHGWALFINNERERSIQMEEAIYRPVTKRMIRRAARHSGTFRDLTRYGAVDQVHPTQIDLGMCASYEAGSRATMRTLARRLQNPFDAVYRINWCYSLPHKQRVAIQVLYDPAMEHGTLEVLDDQAHFLSTYTSANKQKVIRVGRRSGTFKDLLKLGAK